MSVGVGLSGMVMDTSMMGVNKGVCGVDTGVGDVDEVSVGAMEVGGMGM